MTAPQSRGRGDLEIIHETLLVAIPRGEEELRVTHVEGRTGAGKDVAWHSLRVFWRDDSGTWRPGKQGITIRGAELKAVAEALVKAAAGGMRRGPTAPGTKPESGARDDGDLDRLFGEESRWVKR